MRHRCPPPLPPAATCPPAIAASAARSVVALGAILACSACTATPLPGGDGGALPDAAASPDLVLASGRCRSNAECKSYERCLAPGEPAGCGICMRVPDPCTADAECAPRGPAWICAPVVCACGGESRCAEGCVTDSACAAWQVCGADHRCIGRPCAAASDCPRNFACNARCERRACARDADCLGTGLCVGGRCHDEAGTCTPPVP